MFESLYDTDEEKVHLYLAGIVLAAILFLVGVRTGLGKAAI